MRLVAALPLAATAVLLVTSASADIGPPPSCPSGTHQEYLYGHHCVPDGSHLEPNPNGGIKTVSDTPPSAPTGTPTTAPSATAAPSATPSATPASATATPPSLPTSEPPTHHGCACDVTGGASGTAGAMMLALGLALVGVARRKRR